MSKPLVPLTVSAPGFFGLNTQQSGSILPPGWATKLDNFIFDDLGRIACRKGSQRLHDTAITGTPTVEALHEYIDGLGDTVTIFAADNKLWKQVGNTITDITGTAVPTGDDWQFANFNGKCVAYQAGHVPIELPTAIGTFAPAVGTQFSGSMVLSAGGRLWTIVDSTLHYTDLLINDYSGGSSGNLDLSIYWPNGMDEGVSLAEFNGFLIVFGKETIIIYENYDDIDNIALVEGIDGIGCIARDSVQQIGDDLAFLSSTGIRTLKRTLDQGSMPLSDISKHVRDELIAEALIETPVKIKSIYNEVDGFYLLTLPLNGKSYVFDLKRPNEDSTWKAAKWLKAPTALVYLQNNTMLLADEDGYISEYKGFRDFVSRTGSGGNTYNVDWEGPWNDLGEEVANFIKILKQVSVLAGGFPGSTVTFKWAVDYSETFCTTDLTFTDNAPARYGMAQYGIGKYGVLSGFERVRDQLSLTGQVVKIGLTTTIDAVSFAVQRVDLLSKIGKLGL